MGFIEKMLLAGVVWWGVFFAVVMTVWWIAGGRGGRHK